MAGGLFGLLDDVAALARLAAASVDDVGAAAGRATAKAAGVVIDDTAVTPQYVHGLAAEREVPIVKGIAKGSLRNKLLIILPAALLLSQFAPWLLTPLLMAGGAFLCYEAVHKIVHAFQHRGHGAAGEPHAAEAPEEAPLVVSEDEVIKGAVRTDFILSAEIMVIALNEVADESFVSRLAILAVVAVAITIVVYGVVAAIVKMDDAGLRLVERHTDWRAGLGRGLVRAMPRVLSTLSVVGTAAMLWVGGHIELVGLEELGLTAPYDAVHHLEEEVHHALESAGFVADAAAWGVNTFFSAVLGLVVGLLVLPVVNLVKGRLRK